MLLCRSRGGPPTSAGSKSGNIESPSFRELIVRWFQFGVFSPLCRLHGFRGPEAMAAADQTGGPSGAEQTGAPNELWSFGAEAYDILRRWVNLREHLRPYLSTPPFQQALQSWVNMVKDGSASKSVLTWGQDPDLTQQFLHAKAAMIIDGPWIFPELNAAGWKYDQQYGIVPIPVRQAGQTVITPLGGETMDIGAGGSSAQEQAAWEWIEGLQQPAVIQQYLKGGTEYTVFAQEIETARPRTTEFGTNYPKVSQAIWTAIQAAAFGDDTTAVLVYDTETVPVASAPAAECVTVTDGKITHNRFIFDRAPFDAARQAGG